VIGIDDLIADVEIQISTHFAAPGKENAGRSCDQF